MHEMYRTNVLVAKIKDFHLILYCSSTRQHTGVRPAILINIGRKVIPNAFDSPHLLLQHFKGNEGFQKHLVF